MSVKLTSKHPLLRIFENTWLQHIVFWGVYLAPTSYYLLTVCEIENGSIPLIVIVFLTLATAYFNLNYLVPKFLLEEKYVTYLVSLVTLLIVFCAIYTLWYIFFLEYFFKVTDHESYQKAYLNNIFELAIMLMITTAFKLSKDWFRQQQINRDLSTEKLKAEVQFLRTQINPHFLFNTLNNLYGLALKKSDKTPEAIIKLSEMMEYMLYESDENLVPLDKETKYIQTYVEIEKLRYLPNRDIQLDISPKIANYSIAPFILLPFVENAFKHGENLAEENTFIHISITIKNDYLDFIIKNSKPSSSLDTANNGCSGVGIQNVKKRLRLLYKDKHHLTINDTEKHFVVNLEICLI